jgi:hypothetical protein
MSIYLIYLNKNITYSLSVNPGFSLDKSSITLNKYTEEVKDCAGQVAISVCFTQTYTVQLLDSEGTNPMKAHGEKRKIWFQVTISNL